MAEFTVTTPVGWDGVAFSQPTKDQHLHHIEIWDIPDQDWVSLIFFWNKPYAEIPVDEKFSYRSKNYHMKLSYHEANQLYLALGKHLEHYVDTHKDLK